MAEQFTESFRIKSVFYANSCIGMTEKMKVDISDTAKLQNRLKAILHGPWLSRLASSGDDIKVIFVMNLHVFQRFGIRPQRKFHLTLKTHVFLINSFAIAVFTQFYAITTPKFENGRICNPFAQDSKILVNLRSALPSAVSVSGLQPRYFN